MAKKKGKKGKKGSKDAVEVVHVSARDWHDIDERARHQYLCGDSNRDWVKVEAYLLHWTHLKVESVMRTTSTLDSIVRMLQERTGSLSHNHVRLYRDPPSHHNLLYRSKKKPSTIDVIEQHDSNDSLSKTLSECGYHGGTLESPVAIIVFFEFETRIDDPLLLVELPSWQLDLLGLHNEESVEHSKTHINEQVNAVKPASVVDRNL